MRDRRNTIDHHAARLLALRGLVLGPGLVLGLGLGLVLVLGLGLGGFGLGGRPAAAGAAAARHGAAVARRRQELQALRQQLDRERREAKRLRGDERKVLSELQSVDKQLSVMQRYLGKLEEQESALDARLVRLAVEIDTRQAELEASQGRLVYRIRQIYKQGQPSIIEVVFASESLPDLFRRIDYMMRLADEEKRLMAETEEARSELLAARREVEQSRLEVQVIREEKATERAALLDLKGQRRSHLRRISSERRAREAAISELAEAQKRLEELIESLEAQTLADGDFVPLHGPFAEAAGKLPWPVRGRLVGTYGLVRDPAEGTETRSNGIDIQAPLGAPVRAVADGKVAFREWLTGYGNCIILNHGSGYYTFYAHASEVLVAGGQTVASGDVIARVGETGSLKGPVLHFEVRKGSRALDPRRWLAR